jgi:hypothetical protein
MSAAQPVVAHDLEPADVDTLHDVRRYQIKNKELLDILLPAGDQFCVNLSLKKQNTQIFCTFLRRRLKRASYDWHKHPDCSRYNLDHGCLILEPFCSTAYNNAVPYDNMYEFLEAMSSHPDFVGLASDKQRKRLYRVLNDGLGGPHGKVC